MIVKLTHGNAPPKESGRVQAHQRRCLGRARARIPLHSSVHLILQSFHYSPRVAGRRLCSRGRHVGVAPGWRSWLSLASDDPRGIKSRSLLHRFQRLSAYSVACFAMALFSVACFSAARARARALACWPRAIRPPKYCIEFRLTWGTDVACMPRQARLGTMSNGRAWYDRVRIVGLVILFTQVALRAPAPFAAESLL